MFFVGDLVTFKDHLTLFDGNKCLVTFKGNLVRDPYDKPGRIWIVMTSIPKGVYGNAEELFLLCPIAEGPEEQDGEKGVELPEGTFGLIHHDTYFQRGAATVAPEAGLRPWLIPTKAKSKQPTHSLARQPEWPALFKAFWNLWSKAAQFPVERWNKLAAESKKTKPAKEAKKK